MACTFCAAARETSGLHTLYSPNCLWCGARLIQRLGMLHRPREELIARRRQVLADWMQYGHAEAELRALAKSQGLPLEPEAGPAPTSEPEPRSREKSRSRSKR